MRRKSRKSRRSSSRSGSSTFSGWWRNLRRGWRTANKVPWIIASVVGVAVAGAGFLLYSVSTLQNDRRSLTCLALNIYFEARGESVKGQYAVAEVTMNRVASPRYPDSVCEAVYEKRWDRIRQRYVSAFSWTEYETLPSPDNEEFQAAWKVAEDVYHGRHEPSVGDAVLFHATYIRPSWARHSKQVARIGGHIFYE